MISQIGLSAILLAASAVAAPERMPQPGSYAFNWLDESSHCKKLSAKDLAPVKSCAITNNAFGLELNSHVCKVNSHIELMVYKTAAQCKEALETMHANGP